MDTWTWDDALTLAAAVERDQRLGRADHLGPYTALVTVERDGTLNVACSCGDADLAHPSGREKYTLDRLSSHMQLHATAALTGTPWEQVLAHRDRLRARRPGT